jgi:hypothetical protein
MGLVEKEKGVIPQILPLERSQESGPCNGSTNATTEIPAFLLKQREFMYKRATELQKDELWNWNRIFESYISHIWRKPNCHNVTSITVN